MIIYNRIINGQWEDFDSALDACRNELDAYDIWDEFENCDNFSKVEIVKLLVEHCPDLIDEACHKASKFFVEHMYTDEEDEDELEEIKSDYFLGVC